MLKMITYNVLKIGFHGDTFLAWQHMTNGIFHLSLNVFLYNKRGPSKRDSSKCNSNKTHITKSSLKSVNFTFFLGQLSANLQEILIFCFHGNHCQKKGMLCIVIVFQQFWLNGGNLHDSYGEC